MNRERPASRRMITRAILSEYWIAQSQSKKLHDQPNRMRERLLELRRAGAEVEPGPLALRVEAREDRRPTWADLVAVPGEEQADDLRALMPSRRVDYVFVGPIDRGRIDRPGRGGRSPSSAAIEHSAPTSPEPSRRHATGRPI